jgi:hypothetical protein
MAWNSTSGKKKSDTTSSGASSKAVASFRAWGEYQKELKTTETRLLAGSRKNPMLTTAPAPTAPAATTTDYSKLLNAPGGKSPEQAQALYAVGVALASSVRDLNMWTLFICSTPLTLFSTLFLFAYMTFTPFCSGMVREKWVGLR